MTNSAQWGRVGEKQELHLFPCAHLFQYMQVGMDCDNVLNLHRIQLVSDCRHHQASQGVAHSCTILINKISISFEESSGNVSSTLFN